MGQPALGFLAVFSVDKILDDSFLGFGGTGNVAISNLFAANMAQHCVD